VGPYATGIGAAKACLDLDVAAKLETRPCSTGSLIAHVPLAVEVTAAPVRDTAEIEEAIVKLGHEPGSGLIVAPDAFTIVHQHLFIRLAQQHRLPAVYFLRTSVAQGALMSYGPDVYDNFRRSASYVDRILKGAKPADLPVQQPTKFELAINLKTAKALGLTVPETLLARADEVIE